MKNRELLVIVLVTLGIAASIFGGLSIYLSVVLPVIGGYIVHRIFADTYSGGEVRTSYFLIYALTSLFAGFITYMAMESVLLLFGQRTPQTFALFSSTGDDILAYAFIVFCSFAIFADGWEKWIPEAPGKTPSRQDRKK